MGLSWVCLQLEYTWNNMKRALNDHRVTLSTASPIKGIGTILHGLKFKISKIYNFLNTKMNNFM